MYAVDKCIVVFCSTAFVSVGTTCNIVPPNLHLGHLADTYIQSELSLEHLSDEGETIYRVSTVRMFI